MNFAQMVPEHIRRIPAYKSENPAEEIERGPRMFKIVRLESYEDTLNNLELRRSEAQQSLIDHLEGVLESKDLSKRAEVLHRVTDLFIQGSGRFSPEQIDLFDEVMIKRIQTEMAKRYRETK